jgi:hypothetical protein
MTTAVVAPGVMTSANAAITYAVIRKTGLGV